LKLPKKRMRMLFWTVMQQTPGLSLMDMAKVFGWNNSKGKPDKRRVQKGMDRLKGLKLVVMDAASKRFKLTDRGEAAPTKTDTVH
jgi:hypothetical protein